jgi:pimeloyl-ACP methyl ester carboxylesterase
MKQITSADGTTIAYERFGSGHPIVLVGGALCDRTAHRPLAEELGRRGFTGVTYDRRSRGSSGSTGSPALQREIDDLSALVNALGGSVAVYGHSSGAALALHAAANSRSITHLVVHEAPFNPDEPEARAESQAYHHQLVALLDEDRPDEAVEFFMRTVGTPDEAIADMQAEPWWPGLVALAHSLLHDSEVMGDRAGGTLPSGILDSVSTPTLVIYGDQSPPWMLDVAEQLVDGLPDGALRVLPGEDHVVPPETLAPVLGVFVTTD